MVILPQNRHFGVLLTCYRLTGQGLRFWATVCKTVRLCDRSVVCLSVFLSVTLVYCGQTVRWIKMKLGTEVGLGPGHIVLDGDPAPPPQRGTALPNFRPMSVLLWPSDWIDQDATW